MVLANRPTAADFNQMLSYGATACLSKETEARDVISAIHLAARGMHVLPQTTNAHGGDPVRIRGVDQLTPREGEVLEQLQEGATNAEIAERARDRRGDRAHARAQDLPQARHRLAPRAGPPGAPGPASARAPQRRPSARRSGGAQQVPHPQQLGHLDRVGGGALAEVVADDPEVEAALVRGVAADAPHEHVVAPGRVERQRVEAVRRVVHHRHARGRGEQLAAVLR